MAFFIHIQYLLANCNIQGVWNNVEWLKQKFDAYFVHENSQNKKREV